VCPSTRKILVLWPVEEVMTLRTFIIWTPTQSINAKAHTSYETKFNAHFTHFLKNDLTS
jgi:hypothetical protein